MSDPIEADVLLKIEGLKKTFVQGERTLTIFDNLDLKIEAGEIVALVGPSGAGKSTLLQIAGLLDQPTSGSIRIRGKAVQKLSDGERTKLRRDYIGFVYQFHHLLPEFTALENVAMPQIIAGIDRAAAHAKAAELLTDLGLGERLTHRPTLLSGGEQQRVAIARALANDATLLFADEPTGNLDPETSAEVFEILVRQVRERGIGALIATHNLALADQMDRVLELKYGRLVPF
jgi:lipoprotein-releasing system ATP-binding protein